MLGMNVAQKLAQEKEDDHDHEGEREHERIFDVRDRGADRLRAIGDEVHVHRARNRLLELRQSRLDAVDDVDRVGARRALDQQDLGQLLAVPGAGAIADRAIRHRRNVPELDRRSVAVGDDHTPELRGVGELVVGVDGQFLAESLKVALRLVDAGVLDGARDLRESEAHGRERVRVEAHLHGRLLLRRR